MPDIFHDFAIAAKRGAVFDAITLPSGLDAWWTKTCTGVPTVGGLYSLGFGPGYDWRARVTEVVPNECFELQVIQADEDWTDTRVRFELLAASGVTPVHFRHLGWASNNDVYRVSCFCWALYLRHLRRYVEHGERLPYEQRINA